MAPGPDKPARKVFLVDDHPLVRESLTNLINRQPDLAVCGEAESVAEAMRGIAVSRPDVAIVDLSLAEGQSGIELIGSLHQFHPDVSVLVLSAHPETHHAECARRAGARGYVMKQEAAGKVVEGIRQVAAGRLFFTDPKVPAPVLWWNRAEPVEMPGPDALPRDLAGVPLKRSCGDIFQLKGREKN